MGGEGEQQRVEAHGASDALEHVALEVVLSQDPRATAKGKELLDMAAQEAIHAGIQDEPEEDAPQVAEHHDESP
jgi:hypothetical protein